MSSDDGIRMLYLDFGGKDGEIVSTVFSKGMHVTISLVVLQAVGVEALMEVRLDGRYRSLRTEIL